MLGVPVRVFVRVCRDASIMCAVLSLQDARDVPSSPLVASPLPFPLYPTFYLPYPPSCRHSTGMRATPAHYTLCPLDVLGRSYVDTSTAETVF